MHRAWRDSLLFLGGLGLTIHEAVIYVGPVRPEMLVLYAAMMGLPAFLRHDERNSKRAAEREEP